MIFEIAFNLFAIIWAILLYYCIRACIRPKNFPKGPVILPFIGSAWTIPAKGIEFLIPKWTKKYGNTIGHKLYHEKLVIFCESEDIFDGLKHPNLQGRYQSKLFMQRTRNKPLGGLLIPFMEMGTECHTLICVPTHRVAARLVVGFFFGDDETWSEVRRFTLRYFGTVFNTELETILHDELLEDFNSIRSGKITDIDGKFMKTPLNVMLRILTGTHRKNHQHRIDDMQEKTEKAFIEGRLNGIELVYPIFRGLFKNHVQLEAIKAAHGFLKERFEEHKQHFDKLDIKDYTDAFINESKKELELYGKVVNFTDDEFLSCGIDMIQAGNESTGKTIEFVLMYVALNQKVQDKLHEEIDRVVGQNRYPTLNDRISLPYLESTIYETMRINPISANGVIHRVTEDTHFKGYFLEKDTLLYFALKYAMNDPKKWKNPEEFMPERFMDSDGLKKKLPNFGSGKRSCIGGILAKNFMFLYLAYFFQRYSIQFPFGYKPSTYPILGLTNGPQPFKLIISDRRNANRL